MLFPSHYEHWRVGLHAELELIKMRGAIALFKANACLCCQRLVCAARS